MMARKILLLLLLTHTIILQSQITNAFPDDGNAGIGTTNPTGKLEVLNDADLSSAITLPNSAFIIRADDDGNDASLRFGVDNSNLKAVIQTQQTTTGTKFDLLMNPFGGNVGIGTLDPQLKLQVEGSIGGILRHESNYFRLYPYNSSYDDGSYAKTFYDGNKKQIRFWNSDSNTNYTRLESGGVSIGSPNPISTTNGFENRIEFLNGSHGAIVFHPGQTDELMFGMHVNGNFYWGTGSSHSQNSDYYSMFLDGLNGNLGIRGKLTADEVKVKLGGWADYVFDPGYGLLSLNDLERHIKEKGHLPNIPSAKEVEENGVELGEMNKLLLEKIEELTLYVIALKKGQLLLEEEIEILRKNEAQD